MSQEDDLRALAKIRFALLTISMGIIALHVYWLARPFLGDLGPLANGLNIAIGRLDNSLHIFSSIWKAKLTAFLFFAISAVGERGVKNTKITWRDVALYAGAGLILYWGNFIFPMIAYNLFSIQLYGITYAIAFFLMVQAVAYATRLLKNNLMDDPFNVENESFQQETRYMENEYSVNLRSRFYYKKKWNAGWINIINPFRATMVLGTPGSGKSFAVVNSFIKQQIEKGFAMYIYDYKFPDLSTIAYNHLRLYGGEYRDKEGNEIDPEFLVINFDDPKRSNRCNPIAPEFMYDIADAYEAAYTIMLNLNKTWIQKQGDFFVESPIILLAAIIWYLKIVHDGKFCTFPHAIELLNQPYKIIFPILTTYDELANYLSPFMDAWKGGAQDQLQGQIASAKIPLSRMISPALYWVMTGDDFSLDINNPNNPKILVIGNNPDRQNIYSAALGLYNNRIVKLINKKGQLKSSVIIDELPTIYFRGLDNLIATARSNKVAVCLGFQDFSQLARDYGDKEAKVIQNTVANVFSGQVVGDSAKLLSERFGKILQQRQSMSINRNDTSTSISTQLDYIIPASKISNLSQGMFVGTVADNFDQRIDQKIFNCQIKVDTDRVKADEKRYIPIPEIYGDQFPSDEEMKEIINKNYRKVKDDIKSLVSEEINRMKSDPVLRTQLDEKAVNAYFGVVETEEAQQKQEEEEPHEQEEEAKEEDEAESTPSSNAQEDEDIEAIEAGL